MSRYEVTVFIEGPKVDSVFELLSRIPIFYALTRLAAKAGYRVTGYTAKPVK